MQKLINAVQNYAWGSHTALTELYGIANGLLVDGQHQIFVLHASARCCAICSRQPLPAASKKDLLAGSVWQWTPA